MSNRTESNPFALARAGRIRNRAKLPKAELNARHDAAPEEYLRGDVVIPTLGVQVQVSSPGLFNDILDRMAQLPKALPLDELDEAAQQFRELFRQYGVPIERVLRENRRKIEENQRKIDDTSAERSKGGKISGKTRAQKTVALDAAVREILPTLSGSHRKQPQSAGAIQAVKDKLPTNIKESYKSGSAISKSIGRVRGVRTRGSTRVPN